MDRPRGIPASSFASALAKSPELATLGSDAWARLSRLALASPLYARWLEQYPAWALWLESPENLQADYRYSALLHEWQRFQRTGGESLASEAMLIDRLRRWRRLMSLRVAYRNVNRLASEKTSVEELTRLAEFCLRECHHVALRRWSARCGQPWDDDLQRPARYCVLALGKMGGEELNFSSDIDLLFMYEGDGYCRLNHEPGTFSNVEFYTQLATATANLLNGSSPEGFLFRVDLRLRPEGNYGPLVRSTSSLENYYAATGQTWERLAFLKARPVAGDLPLGAEFLENIQSFRYPRHPPPSLLAEIAAMKSRTDRESAQTAHLERNVKVGPGGIREIEFITQALQLLHAGQYPFLQTHSTQAALEQIARYGLLPAGDAAFLREAYWRLRSVEHRIQMREEQQSHLLPTDPESLDAISTSLDYPNAQAFEDDLHSLRQRVHTLFEGFFADQSADEDFEAWWAFFTSKSVPPSIAEKLNRWFRGETSADAGLRLFAVGDARRTVTREQVVAFQHLSARFDPITPLLARPLLALQRLARFAERYGPRSQFFKLCADNPDFLRALALLFDRSATTHELLCAHPEIFEEVIRPEILRHKKDPFAIAREISAGPGPTDEFTRWLALYVRAEQVRLTTAELLGLLSFDELQSGLTELADTTVRCALARANLDSCCGVIALGKWGGRELTFGSDLDLLLVCADTDREVVEARVRDFLPFFRGSESTGHTYDLDLRLRPHGDAGPVATTLYALGEYHRTSAQLWERQALVRARVVTAQPTLQEQFAEWRVQHVFTPPLSEDQQATIWAMRGRIERERDVVSPPERAFKTAAGGLIDIEFLAQIFQLRFGFTHSDLRTPHTASALLLLGHKALLGEDAANALSEHYAFFRRLEMQLRRDNPRGGSVLPADPSDAFAIAFWMGQTDQDALLAAVRHHLQETRRHVMTALKW